MRINLGNSLTDATLLPERILNIQWDGPWLARTQALENGWSAEYFIPWSMMPLPQVEGARKLGFYFERQVGHLQGETWSNPPLPRTVNEYLSAFELYELTDIEPRTQITYYPFASGIYDGVRGESTYKVGTELFWRPTSNSLLSASLNPDFGNVESDDVVVNLTAFEVFFPERRAFFLEGQDVFNTSPRTQVAAAPAALSRCSIRAGSVAQRYTIFPMTLTLSPPIAVSPRSYSVRRSSQGKPETGATGRWSLARMTRRFAAPLTMVRR